VVHRDALSVVQNCVPTLKSYTKDLPLPSFIRDEPYIKPTKDPYSGPTTISMPGVIGVHPGTPLFVLM
jgi:hypothetical protein